LVKKIMECHNCGHKIAFSQNRERVKAWGWVFHADDKGRPVRSCECGCKRPSYLATEKDQPRPKDLRKALERMPEEKLWKMMQRQHLSDQGIERVDELERQWRLKQSLTAP
jgi:tRNA U34 5-methylaminomethyl-2-thiouridine-forming methyltransferase MnmC